MTQVGTVKEIWRFPVKSMFGESVSRARIVAEGMPEDRHWALRDDEAGIILGGKRVPKIMTLSARYLVDPSGDFGTLAQAPVEILFPDGRTMRSGDPYTSAALSMYLGKKLSLHPRYTADNAAFFENARPMSAEEMRHYLGMRADGPDADFSDFSLKMLGTLIKYTTPPGTYYDAYPLHFMTTASLAHMKTFYPGDFRAERYRPNFLIETDSGITGFAEFGWEGRKLRVGDVEINCVHRTIRCSQPGAEQPGGIAKDPKIPQAVMQHAEQNLGAYATTKSTGHINVGDTVELLPEGIVKSFHFLQTIKKKAKSVILDQMAKSMGKEKDAPAPPKFPKGFESFKLVRKIRESEGIASFHFEPTNGQKLARFVPGQHLTLALPNAETGKNIYRPYSLSDSAEELGQYRISVKRETAEVDGETFEGAGSCTLHDRLEEGATVYIKGPSGPFGDLPGDEAPLALICNGIGITPFIGMIRTLAKVNPDREVRLFYGVRTLDHLAFRNELEAAQKAMSNLTLHVHLSQPAVTEDISNNGFAEGRLAADKIVETLGGDKDWRYFLCGSSEFTSDMLEGLAGAGIDKDAVHHESFSQKRSQGGKGDGKQYAIRFSRTDVEATWDGGADNLLSFTEDSGVDVASGCRYGACQACECTLVWGDIAYLDDIEEPAGKGRILLCSAQPKSDLVIDL